LLDELEDRDLREIDLLRAGQIEQEVERTFPAV